MELQGGGNGQRHQTAQRDQVELDGKVPYSIINTKVKVTYICALNIADV